MARPLLLSLASALPTALAMLLPAAAAMAQGDPLASKSLPLLLADQGRLYAFADDGIRYSRIDPFADPVDIRSTKLPFRTGVEGGVGRSVSLLLYLNDHRPKDSVNIGVIASLDRNGKTAEDSLYFRRSAGKVDDITAGVEISALALWHDTVVVGGGNAGIAVARPKAGGSQVLGVDSLFFQALPEGGDTAVTRLRCAVGRQCLVDSLTALVASHGEPDSVLALAVDSSAADSVWLLIGTDSGLRRGLLGGDVFPEVALPGDTGAAGIRIERIHADARNRILWIFSGSRYFFSDDHGATFRVPPDVPGVATSPGSDLKGFSHTPEAANLGDTSYVNFNLDLPGLVLFRRDSVLRNQGTGSPADALLDAEDGLDFARGQGRLTSLAVLRSGAASAVAVGTTGKGLFYRLTGPGRSGAWNNINSLKGLQGGLDEIITFPTVFTGIARDGAPAYVNLGYRLKKDGKVTITVYNYAMEKVKVLVKGAPRKGGGSRSEVAEEDRWDGRDRSGRLVSVGVYYILVESDKGEKGWGKAIHARGRN